MSEKKRSIYWETVGIHDDGTIVNVVAGQYKRVYGQDHPDYEKAYKYVTEKYPGLGRGKICTYLRYTDGTSETTIKEYDSYANST